MLKPFLENKCRLCGIIKLKGVNLFSASAKRNGLISKISKRLSREVHIAAGDELPKFVCSDCEGIINKFSEFCAVVQSVQKQLEREKLNFINGNGESADVNCDVDFSVKHAPSAGYGFGGSSAPTVMVGPGSQVECTLCGRFLDAADHTTLHMVSHGIGTVICQCRSCGQQGELPHFLHAGDKRSIWCKACRPSPQPKGTTLARVSGGKPFACDICSKTFRSRGHLGRHQVTHTGAKPFLCDVCGCGFSQKSSLKLHVLGHARLDPHKCSHCGQAFRLKVSLHSHMLNVHGGTGIDKLTKHKCDKCGKRFVTVYKLHRHYRCHTGDRPYECPRCGRLFSQTGNLNLHKKKHEEEDNNSSFHAPAPATFDTSLVPPSDDQFIPTADDLDAKYLGDVLPQQLRDPGQYDAPHFGSSSGDFLVVASSTDKTKSTESELYAHFSDNGLMFMEEDGGPDSETITLPTFSSLQAGALPHH